MNNPEYEKTNSEFQVFTILSKFAPITPLYVTLKFNRMKAIVYAAIALLFPMICWGQTLSKVGDGYCRTSVNTTVFRASSVVTHEDTQYVAYYDPEGYVPFGRL